MELKETAAKLRAQFEERRQQGTGGRFTEALAVTLRCCLISLPSSTPPQPERCPLRLHHPARRFSRRARASPYGRTVAGGPGWSVLVPKREALDATRSVAGAARPCSIGTVTPVPHLRKLFV